MRFNTLWNEIITVTNNIFLNRIDRNAVTGIQITANVLFFIARLVAIAKIHKCVI